MSIEEMVKQLPAELQKEVKEFVQSLLEKRTKKRGVMLHQDWGVHFGIIARSTLRWNFNGRRSNGEETKECICSTPMSGLNAYWNKRNPLR